MLASVVGELDGIDPQLATVGLGQGSNGVDEAVGMCVSGQQGPAAGVFGKDGDAAAVGGATVDAASGGGKPEGNPTLEPGLT